MNDQTLKDIDRRLKALEQTTVRYRAGEITDTAPLDVALGGSDVAYEDVQALGPVATGDQVATLVWGNDLLVLGALGRGIRFGTVILNYTASATSAQLTVAHELGTTPEIILALPAGGANRHVVNYVSGTRDATSFDLIAETNTSAAITAALTVFWLVVG